MYVKSPWKPRHWMKMWNCSHSAGFCWVRIKTYLLNGESGVFVHILRSLKRRASMNHMKVKIWSKSVFPQWNLVLINDTEPGLIHFENCLCCGIAAVGAKLPIKLRESFDFSITCSPHKIFSNPLHSILFNLSNIFPFHLNCSKTICIFMHDFFNNVTPPQHLKII